MKLGRPFAFETDEELQERIDEYWDYCEEKERPKTFCGLAYYLGITRQTLHNYGAGDKFGHIITRARERIEMDMDERLQMVGNATTGIIFSLKNNYHWDADNKVKAEIESTNTNKNYDLSNLSTEQIKELLKDE